MSRTIFLFILAGLMSLACLAPAGAAVSSPVVEVTPISDSLAASEPPYLAVGEPVEVPATDLQCARVTAVEALTVRESPGVDGAPVGWLLSGDLVRLAGPAAGEWWPVRVDGRAGWARSAFLEVVTCGEVER